MMIEGHALDLIEQLTEAPDLVVTGPPYAFGAPRPASALDMANGSPIDISSGQ